ncbi:MAG: hypothetical protein LH628_24270 [Microcoleus sp. CAN_BIN18]|nr:hypothetical protein [Microcoleus sp. CAN_BIN18]
MYPTELYTYRSAVRSQIKSSPQAQSWEAGGRSSVDGFRHQGEYFQPYQERIGLKPLP